MIRARYAFAATLVASLVPAPRWRRPRPRNSNPFSPARTSRQPLRGAAEVEFAKPPVKREKDMVIDEFTVKNISTAPIARLTIEAIYYDKGGAVIAGGKNFVNGLLKPGEVQTVTVETPYNARHEREQLQVHARQRRRQHRRGSTRSWIRPPQRRPPRPRPPPRKPPPTESAARSKPLLHDFLKPDLAVMLRDGGEVIRCGQHLRRDRVA